MSSSGNGGSMNSSIEAASQDAVVKDNKSHETNDSDDNNKNNNSNIENRNSDNQEFQLQQQSSTSSTWLRRQNETDGEEDGIAVMGVKVKKQKLNSHAVIGQRVVIAIDDDHNDTVEANKEGFNSVATTLAATTTTTTPVGEKNQDEPRDETTNTNSLLPPPPTSSNGSDLFADSTASLPNIAQVVSEVVTKYKQLFDLPDLINALPALSDEERKELELVLQLTNPNRNGDAPSNFGTEGTSDWWCDDWSGNLALMQKEIPNPIISTRPQHHSKRRQKSERKPQQLTLPLWEWAQQEPSSSLKQASQHALRLGRNLLALVYDQAPMAAKRILGYASWAWESDPLEFDIFDVIKRCSYDPSVLRDDGWTTSPTIGPSTEARTTTSQEQHGEIHVYMSSVSGGPKYIGKEIIWEGFEAVIIAYVLDSEIGDLWKAMWLDGYETFDLEAEELHKALKKWERKYKKVVDKKQQQDAKRDELLQTATSAASSTIGRSAALKQFSVEGIEHGIILATTYNPNARPGVFWPARVMHVSELDKSQTQSKRHSSKQKVNVVFFAPYWNTGSVSAVRSPSPSMDIPLFETECIDVSEETIQKYQHDGRRGLNVHQLRVAFRFTGLPKSVFGRFLDSHRMAMALKLYAQDQLLVPSSKSHHATAALFDTHALAINTARFPSALLNLPFLYMLSKLQSPGKEKASDPDGDMIEPVICLAHVIKAMEPPLCFGSDHDEGIVTHSHPFNGSHERFDKSAASTLGSPQAKHLLMRSDSSHLDAAGADEITVELILSEFLLEELTNLARTDLPSSSLLGDLVRQLIRANRIIKRFNQKEDNDVTLKKATLKSLLQASLRMKSYGEDTLAADCILLSFAEQHSRLMLIEWRRSCERLYKFLTVRCSYDGFGSGVTFVLSDSRCNQHITAEGCVERAIRLPAALKGAKLAGAGTTPSFPIEYSVEDHYMKLATDTFLEKTHTVSYLKKMKTRCASIAPNVHGTHLTEDSNGEGGCDTTGASGTYDAAVAGVAAALKAVDLIVGGHCVNAFCATRPPGHHAGRDLHPMNAVSNGFCVLNPVACAAIYATTPPSEGGLGLKRAVVIDFDVHHGNGTQDILCSTYDPRFLYISMHAGGALVNGYETDNSDADFTREGNKKQEGIFPGRCGDTSPHKGVLNLPLGGKVTPHDVGNVLVSLIEPAVERFSPDIVILSAGFDGHKNDPLGMGGLSAHDFGHITEVACAMAFRYCSGRVMSVLEGGYGVPCCRPQKDDFVGPTEPIENKTLKSSSPIVGTGSLEGVQTNVTAQQPPRVQPLKLMDLGECMPVNMDDQVTPGLQRKLEKCYTEGFVDCVREHVTSLKNNNSRC